MNNGKSATVLSGDEGAVRGVLQDAIAAWSNGDAKAFAACYSDGATVVVPNEYLKGRENIQHHMVGRFAGPLRGTSIVDRPDDVRFIGSDLAVVVSFSAIKMPGESDVPDERLQRATWVLSRNSGHWQIEAYAI